MTDETRGGSLRNIKATVRRMGRSLPPVSWRDAELERLTRETERLTREIERQRRQAARRGAGREQWKAPGEDTAVRLVRASGLFDEAWYVAQLDAGPPEDHEPLRHYLRHGAEAGHSPHPAFVPSWYVEQIRSIEGYGSRNKIAAAPLLHYLSVGATRRLSPHPGFDAEAYDGENPDAGAERFGPLAHFLRSEGTTCVAVRDELPDGLGPAFPRVRRTAEEFLDSARVAGAVVRDSRGYQHLERDHPTFDQAAEAALKASLLTGDDVRQTAPKVSVVLPSKDRASVVVTAVASVLGQTYRNLELIVVDDGSVDSTEEALAEFGADPRLVYVRHEEARGVAAARNTGLARATGELIAYMDSDNTWRPDFLQLMVAFLVGGGHRVGYAMSALIEQGGKERRAFRGMPFSREALRERNYIDCICLVHERSLIDETGGFDEKLRRNVDWDLFIRLADVADFAFLPVIATEYDPWETHTDRITTEVPPSYRAVVRQRALMDWEAAQAGLAERDADLTSLIVVTTEQAAGACATIFRALATATTDIEVVVVDAHMPAHESIRLLMAVESHPRIRVHRLTQELSIEVARNVGASLSRGGTLLFMAEDVWCEQGWDAPLIEALGTHGAVQPVLLTSGGAVSSAGLHFVAEGRSVQVHGGLPGDAPEVRGVRTVDAVTGTCVAVRADEFVGAEGFDALFLNHLDGGELSVRLAERTGRPPACVGTSRIAQHESVDEGPDTAVERARGRSSARDNERFQTALWRGRSSIISDRLDHDGFSMVGIQTSGRPGAPGTALLLRERGDHPLRWAIKIGAPNVARRENWGDWHFAMALRDSLERLGHHVSIDCHEEWYRPTAHLDDVVLVLRGLTTYELNPLQTNLIWVISHPDLVTIREIAGYDLVFGASARWCARVNRREQVAQLLLQCTDDLRFRPVEPDSARAHSLLAVVNARGRKPSGVRASVAAALEAGLVPAVYGERWDDLLPEGAWKGTYIANEELPGVYSAAGAVLNDHWPDMREEGLLSNRLFDLTACNARVISDHLPEIGDVFGDVVLTYEHPDEIPDLLRRHENETEDRRRVREQLGERVRREHTFDARAQVLSERVSALRAASVGSPF